MKAVAGKFPNGTTAMMAFLKVKVPALTWVDYCAIPPTDRLVWNERGNELNNAMLYLMNLKNKIAKKDLRLVYSQGNITVHQPTIEGMTRYLSTQYPNNKPSYQCNGKRG